MKYLIDEAKADVNATARNGLTPLHVAVVYENPEVSLWYRKMKIRLKAFYFNLISCQTEKAINY